MSSVRDLAQRIARLEQQVRARPTLNNQSLDSRIGIFDSEGRLSGILGQQADGTIALTTIGGAPPPQPVDPTVTAAPAALVVSHTGAFAAGAAAPLNLSHFEIHVGAVDAFTPEPATVVGTFAATGVTKTVALPVGVQVYVCVTAITTSGVRSAPSAYIPGTPSSVVDPAVLAQVQTDVAAAQAEAANALAATQNIGPTQISDEAITTAKLAAESVIASKLAANSVLAASIKAGEVTAGKLAAEAVLAGNLAANSVLAGNIAVGAVTAGTISATAIDGMTITGALMRTAATGVKCEISNFTDTSGTNGEVRFTTSTGEVSRLRATTPWSNGSGMILTGPRVLDDGGDFYMQAGVGMRTHGPGATSVNLGVADGTNSALDRDFNSQGVRVQQSQMEGIETHIDGAALYVDTAFNVTDGVLDPNTRKIYLNISSGIVTFEGNPWHVIGAAGEIPFTNSWVPLAGGNAVPAWRRDLAYGIELDGVMKGGAVGVAAFTLPAEARPLAGRYWACAASGGTANVKILSNGVVRVDSYSSGATNAFVSLNGIRFTMSR